MEVSISAFAPIAILVVEIGSVSVVRQVVCRVGVPLEKPEGLSQKHWFRREDAPGKQRLSQMGSYRERAASGNRGDFS